MKFENDEFGNDQFEFEDHEIGNDEFENDEFGNDQFEFEDHEIGNHQFQFFRANYLSKKSLNLSNFIGNFTFVKTDFTKVQLMKKSIKHLTKHLMKCWLLIMMISASMLAEKGEEGAFKVGEFEFVCPDLWTSKTPRSAMRKAEIAVPGKANEEPGEVVFFHFGLGNAGGTEANIARWLRQIQEASARENAKIHRTKMGEIPVIFVHVEGTFMSGPPLGRKIPKPEFALLGAIIEAKSGSIFVKFTAPKSVVKAAESDFKTMILSAKN